LEGQYESRQQATDIWSGFSFQIKPFTIGGAEIEKIYKLVAASTVWQLHE
jgi:hypothetical protein